MRGGVKAPVAPVEHADSCWDLRELRQLGVELGSIRAELLEVESSLLTSEARLHEDHLESARNLLHYLALRRRDIRHLQKRLTALGLSSLGRAEAHVLATLDAVLRVLHHLLSAPCACDIQLHPPLSFEEGKAMLKRRTEALLGPTPQRRSVRIMVTMPSEAATDYPLVRDLLAGGMDCMRINAVYDDADAWARMIGHLRRAEQELDRRCRVLIDLAGPKLRTGPIEAGSQVIKWRPQRDGFGIVTAPARIILMPIGTGPPPVAPAEVCLPVPGEWLAKLQPGDTIQFFDTRGASRFMKVTKTVGVHRRAESTQTAYIAPGTVLHLIRPIGSGSKQVVCHDAKVGELPANEQSLLLRKGNTLIITRDLIPGHQAEHDEEGRLVKPATIGVTLPQVFDDVRPGERVWLDDGKIGGFIRSLNEREMRVEIAQARGGGARLAADKGINLPDSRLRLPALTHKDIQNLPFIAEHADLVGFSFVKNASDVHELQSRMKQVGGEQLGIVLKIETLRAFEQLPNLMLAAMRSPCAGVMIARGDLAVECGYERMAEVQEEILWVCEAAHMPVIWATQVLENLAKLGQPSRAEITDAAMGERAECVMLNKGPHIVEAVRVLDDIVHRMEAHQSKKKSMLRRLGLAYRFTRNHRSSHDRIVHA